ncbi:probable E3 ubiquitin-protein ligase DTX2 isoform X1 [Electrophorus electricus]|uniref:E3 ubiquitin-protein ligase n=1 Tax=Electrophorus electricus TaxID=8005 RepID=A0AAY5F1N4_ELEEL|nr:probable E3 ubiquitin-protein ligase DTX2 isoform X1 [Electrophorus electricus]
MATASGFSSGVSGSRNGPSFLSPSGIPGQAQPMVVVWEWQDDIGYWRPYSGQVSCYIEQCLQHQRGGGPTTTSISLGQSDPSLAPYIIDIPNLKQFRQDTGKIRSVRRTLFPQSSALGSGVLWEWANDEGSWTTYETRTSILLEHSLQAGQATADLAPHGYNYIVDLTALEQVNKSSGFRRRVRRQGGAPYPLASGSVIHSGPACTCQQCLSHGGTAAGPVPARSRHSFSAGQAGRPGPQVQHGRAASGASPASAYSPYPRRPLSVGNMSWGSPWSPATTSMAQAPGPGQAYSTVANGLSIPAIPLQLNGSSSVSTALAGMASILMSAAGLGVRFMAAPSPQRGSGRPSKAQADSVRRAKRQPRTAAVLKPEEVIKKYMEEVAVVPEEDCIICMERLSCPSGYDSSGEGGQSLQPGAVGKFTKCGHTLHALCMLAMYNNGNKDGSLQCPSCKTIYGEKTGTQPKGKMEIYSIPQSLPGHPDCGTIQIIYNIPPGIQGPEHPNPGQPYTCRGFPRFCFLPDNEKGRKVLELLKLAWTRRLIFTVGTSNTTGEPDTVVWNEIHHKTEMMSNVSGHGYPDPNYLDNVLAELAAQGVTEDCLRRDAASRVPPGSAM